MAAKAAVTACLAGIIFASVDLSAVVDHLLRANLALLGLSILLMLGICWLEAIQFAGIVRALDGATTSRGSFAIALAGRFFGTVSPANVGSDMFRALSMRLLGVPPGEAVRLALVSRLMSSLALAPVIAAGLPFAFAHVHGAEERAALVGVPALILSMPAGLAAAGQIGGRLSRRWAGVLHAVSRALKRAALGSRQSASIWAAASAQHLVRVVAFGVARALGVEIPADVLFAFVPVAFLVAMAPITLGSWGLRELSLVVALGLAGVEPHAALAASVMFGAAGLAFGALCGIFWALAPARPYG